MATKTSELWAVVQEWLDAVPFPPSQSKLGEAVGVTRSAVSDWKSGASRPTPENLRKLSEILAPTMGPEIYEVLLAAVVRDMGYQVKRGDGLSVFVGDEGVYANPDLVVEGEDGNVHHIEVKAPMPKAARKATSSGRARRAAQDAAGEETQDSGSQE
jgi:transcriptional regulator with XRE-family HTH domain